MTQRPNVFGDGFQQVAENALRMMQQAGEVAADALQQIDDGTYDGAAWSRSVMALVDINVQGCLDCAAVVLGRANDADPTYSADITVPADPHVDRELCLTAPLTRVGMPGDVVPAECVGFQPAVLPAGATTFRIRLTDSRYAAANYAATVGLRRSGADPTQPADQTMTVSVAL